MRREHKLVPMGTRGRFSLIHTIVLRLLTCFMGHERYFGYLTGLASKSADLASGRLDNCHVLIYMHLHIHAYKGLYMVLHVCQSRATIEVLKTG